MTHRCIWNPPGFPFPECRDFDDALDAHRFAAEIAKAGIEVEVHDVTTDSPPTVHRHPDWRKPIGRDRPCPFCGHGHSFLTCDKCACEPLPIPPDTYTAGEWTA